MTPVSWFAQQVNAWFAGRAGAGELERDPLGPLRQVVHAGVRRPLVVVPDSRMHPRHDCIMSPRSDIAVHRGADMRADVVHRRLLVCSPET
jgi:hypothetical protein